MKSNNCRAAVLAVLCALAIASHLVHAQTLSPNHFFPPDDTAANSSTQAARKSTTPPVDAGGSWLSDPSASLDRPLYACACGCGVFDVATSTMLPQGEGGMVWFEWDYQNQNHNWRSDSSALNSDNSDKEIRTDFFQLGFQYLFNRSWGVQAQVPFDRRYFKTIDDSGNLASTQWAALGDIRIKGLYTGFFEDLSAGVDFGVKLPTGDYTHPLADRDTQLGTGSTDILLGGYYRTSLSVDHKWNAFTQLEGDFPILIRNRYRPGLEVDGAAGIYYSGLTVGRVGIVPIGQIIGSERASDSGAHAAHPVASGYQRILLSPALEIDVHPFMIYGDVEFPVFQHMKGDQLVAPMIFKVIVSYMF